MSFGQIMGISSQSMMNNQYALTVVSNNIANMDVNGYSKQRVIFNQNSLLVPGTSIIGAVRGLNGASIHGIESYANSTINTSVRNANSQSAYYNQLKTLLGDMSTVANELGDEGLAKAFSDFYTAAQNLSKNPTDSAAREQYVQMCKNITYKFNSIYTNLEEQKNDIAGDYTKPSTTETSKIAITVNEVNSRLERIANLNNQILQVGVEAGAANSLIDERNILLDELSSLIPINVIEQSSGSVTVLLDNIRLVAGSKCEQQLVATTGPDYDTPIVVQVKHMESGKITGNNINDIFDGRGAIGAMLDMVTAKDGFISLNTLMDKLDILANDFANTINLLQTYSNGDERACYITKDAAGNTILAYNPQPPNIFENTGAKNIKVTDEIIKDPRLVTTARVNTNTTDNPNWWQNVGNGANMLIIAETRSKNIIDSLGTGGSPDVTAEGFLTALSTKVGMQGSDITAKAKSFSNVTSVFATERQSLVSVNLDEELADMIKYQRAYEASAKVFSTANDILQVLINLGR